MQAMICELCGSNDIIKQDGVYVCQHCGTKYSVEEAKKLMGVVEIDKSKQTKNYLALARRARCEGNSHSASAYYEKVLIENPNDWEAAFFSTFFRVSQCKLAEISSASAVLCNAIQTSTILILGQSIKLKSDDEKRHFEIDAWSEIANACIGFSLSVAESAKEHKEQFRGTYSFQNANSSAAQWIAQGGKVLITLESMSSTSDYVKEDPLYIHICKKEQEYLAKYGWAFNSQKRNEIIKELSGKIAEKEPDYQAPSVNHTGGCYVATCVYGSYDCPQVWTLRRFRDYTLAETWYGRAFVQIYYAVSPTLVKWFGHTEWFKKMWKGKLDRMVANLNADGVEDTPYEDKMW